MARYAVIWLRNRLLALLAFIVVAAGCGAISIQAAQVFGFQVGAFVGGLGSLALILLVTTHPRLTRWAERLEQQEQNADPRRRFTL